MKIVALVVLLVVLLAAGFFAAYRGGSALGQQWRRVKQAAASERVVSQARDATPDDVQQMLAPYAEPLQESERPLMRIALEAMPRDEATTSKVGGGAWWPQGESAPVDAQGRALTLLAQLNFAELPRPLPGYPQQGLLQIFVATDDDVYGATLDNMESQRQQRNFRIVYRPQLQGASMVLPAVAGARLPLDPAVPRRMRFTVDTEPMTRGDYRFDRMMDHGLDGILRAYAAQHQLDEDSLLDALWEAYDGGGHKLGGYPAFTQEDPRSDGMDELLLQLDSDDAMMWGDSGVANFFISPEDLKRRDFSRVAYHWDCY